MQGIDFQISARKKNSLNMLVREEDERVVIELGNGKEFIEIKRLQSNELVAKIFTDYESEKYDFDVEQDDDVTTVTVTTDEVF